jgi:hypothetical protein
MSCKSDVTVVITSCNRPDLLQRTLRSFVQYNTYPVGKYVVIEDHPNAPIPEWLPENTVYIKNDVNRGQIWSIDRAYKEVTTPFVFHAEDDWEFYRPGFIEASREILDNYPDIIQVWLREHGDTNGLSTMKIDKFPFEVMQWGYDRVWHGFSFNPGLKRMSDYYKIGSYGQHTSGSGGQAEAPISELYRRLGYYAAILPQGYVRHIGEHYSKNLGSLLAEARSSGRAVLLGQELRGDGLAGDSIPIFAVGPFWARALSQLARFAPERTYSAILRWAQRARTRTWKRTWLTSGGVKFLWGLFLARGLWDNRELMEKFIAETRKERTKSWFHYYWLRRCNAEESFPSPEFYERSAESVKALLGDVAAANVLEIGCGNDSSRYRGVDFSPAMLAAFAGRHPGLNLVCADGATYVAAGCKFDLIFSHAVVQYFDPAMLDAHLANAKRMLSPNGRIILGAVPCKRHRLAYLGGCFHNRRGWSLRFFLKSLALRLSRGNVLGTWYSERELHSLAARNGFTATLHRCGYQVHTVLD